MFTGNMRRTRNMLMEALFNGELWPNQYDDELMRLLDEHSSVIPTLQSRGIFNALLHYIYIEMKQKFGPSVTLSKLKKRVNHFRTKFIRFQEFINLPGVTFLPPLHTVRVDGDVYFAQFNALRQVYVQNIFISLHVKNFTVNIGNSLKFSLVCVILGDVLTSPF